MPASRPLIFFFLKARFFVFFYFPLPAFPSLALAWEDKAKEEKRFACVRVLMDARWLFILHMNHGGN